MGRAGGPAIGAIYFLMSARLTRDGEMDRNLKGCMGGKGAGLIMEDGLASDYGWGSGRMASRDREGQCRNSRGTEEWKSLKRRPDDVTDPRNSRHGGVAALQHGRTVRGCSHSAEPAKWSDDFNKPMPPPLAGSSDSASPACPWKHELRRTNAVQWGTNRHLGRSTTRSTEGIQGFCLGHSVGWLARYGHLGNHHGHPLQ